MHARAEGYGRGEHTLEFGLTETVLLNPESLVEFLSAAFGAPGYKPPLLPAVALRVLELAKNPLVSYDEVLGLLESDPLLAGEVLRIAQSPVYGTSEPTRSLPQALARLGLATLSDICLQAAMNTRVFRAAGYEAPMNQLRLHSMAVGHAARLICRQTALFDDLAFLAGLLHDVGAAAALITLAERCPRGDAVPPFELVWTAVREVHAACTAQLVQLWKLPPELTMALSMHHDIGSGNRVHPLAAAVCLADAMVASLGLGLHEVDSESEAKKAAVALGLSQPVLQTLRRQTKELVQTLV